MPHLRQPEHSTAFNGLHVRLVPVLRSDEWNWLGQSSRDRERLDNWNLPNAAICEVCATPKKSYRNGLLLLFLSPLLAAIVAEAVFLIAQRMFGASLIYEQLATISFFGLEVVAVTVLLRVFAFNKNIWPGLFREWHLSFLCRRYGQVFVQASVP